MVHPLIALAQERDGVFLRREALALGYDDRQLRQARTRGVLHRLRHGAYVDGGLWAKLSPREQHLLAARAVMRSACTPSVMSHITAAVAHGAPVWDLPLSHVHLTRLDGRSGRKEAGVAQHHGHLEEEDVALVGGLEVTSPARTVMDVSTLTDVEHTLVVADWMLHKRMVTPAQLRQHANACSLTPGTLGTDLAVRLADGRSESVGETRTRHMCFEGGLPAPEPNCKIRNRYGVVVARVDLAWPQLGVFLEFDGREKYVRYLREGESVVDVVLAEKRRESWICGMTGWRCIRITWADLQRPEATVAHIASVLAGGPIH